MNPNREEAATTIQAAVRGHNDRKKVKAIKVP